MKVATTFNNFSRGKLDHDLNGRYDLPIYTSGSDVFENFFSNFKGNAIFRSGFENIVKFQDCRFIVFKFNKEQTYLALFYANEIKFLSYDGSGNLGFVQSGGSDLVVSSPYSLAECKELDFDQNADVMYIVHPSHAPRKLTRVSATSFTLSTFTRTADPFTGAGDYPSCVSFYKGGLYYGATDNEITTVWRSKIGLYDDMTVGTNDDDGLKFSVSDLTERILWLEKGNNSLIGGSNEAIIAINGGTTSDTITPTTVTASITNTDGASETKPIRKDNLLFYINSQQRKVSYFSYDLLTESFKSQDANVVSYEITEDRIEKLAHKRDHNDLIFTICNGDLLSLNFNESERIIGWHEHTSQADFRDIAVITNNEGDYQLFSLMEYDGNFYICRLAEEVNYKLPHEFFTNDEDSDREAFHRYTAELLKQENHLDISQCVKNYYTSTITYDSGAGTITSSASDFSSSDVGKLIVYKNTTGYELGVFEITGYTSSTVVSVALKSDLSGNTSSTWYKSFSTISGLIDFIGKTLSVVGDGGYLGDFVVDGSGEIDLNKQVTYVVVGLSYDGLIKTFNLGFPIQGVNTQTTMKNLVRVGVRFISSAGGQIGTTLYRMKNIQEYDPSGYYDLPPLPMDGDKFVNYNDTFNTEKCLYIKQDKPLPLKITSIISEVDYGTSH